MKTLPKECSRWERVRLPKNHHQVNLFAGHWTAAPENRSVIKKRAAAVYFLQWSLLCLKNVPAHLIERELGARRYGMQPRTPQLSQSTCLPLSQMRKMLCLLTDVKIRQFTDKEFRSGPDMRLSGANWDFTYFFGRPIVILLTWSQNVSF